MLDILRKKKEHWIGGLIVVAVVAVMAFVGASNTKGNKGAPNEPVAWVNGDIISQGDFYRELQYTLSQYRSVLGDKYDEKLLAAFQIPQRTLDRMVQFKLLSQQAEKMGFFISDQELADTIRSLPYFQKDGKFDAALYSKLPNRGVEERKQREQMGAKRLQEYLSNRVKKISSSVKNQTQLENTQISLQFAEIEFNQLASGLPANPQLEKELLGNEAALKSAYQARKKDFTQPARYKFRQIRTGTPFQASAEIRQKAKAKMDALRPQLTPDNFSELARKQSDDEFAQQGGDRGWVAAGAGLDLNLAQTLESLSPNQVSSVIETPSGYFIVQLLEKSPGEVLPLDRVKTQVASELAKDKTKNEFIETTRKKWEALLAEGKPLDTELSKLKIPLKKTEPFSLAKDSIPQIGNSEPLLDAVFELSLKQPIAKRLFFFQDKYYYVKLLSVKPIKPSSDKPPVADASVASFQRDLLDNWMKALEKQASIKISDSLKQKADPRAASL